MNTIHFLAAADGTPLTKSFDIEEGQLVKQSYPQVATFNSFTVDVSDIEDFYTYVTMHASYGHCLLKGQLDRELNSDSRAGHTHPSMATQWMVLDNDHLHDVEPQALMELLGLSDVDYIVQYSASAGIVPGKCGYHIFFLLDRPWSPGDLKLVLRAWNLDMPPIRQSLQLSGTYNSLLWPLDITVCQNDRLTYIAPPVLGPGVQDSFTGERIWLVKGSRRVATLTAPTEPEDLLKQRENAVLDQLRQAAGRPPKKLETRTVKGEIVLKNPDQAEITGSMEERGFAYVNLNGGDSWGYYHPIGSPEFLYNFKGEPNYLIKELLPDYYPHALVRAAEVKTGQALVRQRADIDLHTQLIREAEAKGRPFLVAFRDKRSDQYYAGWIDTQDQSHDLHAIGSKGRIQDLFVQNGYPRIETIPSCDLRFEPSNDALYALETGFINRYTPSRYLRQAQRRDNAAIPDAILRVIWHVLGEDPVVVEHFINWFAVLFRYRIRTQTGWILQGTTGTGKGLLVSQVIRPLIGDSYCRLVNLANLEEQFNGFTDGTIVLFIDEVDTDQVKNGARLIARCKTWITESAIPLRAMRQDLREVPNHLNLILSSNQPNSMRIEANDRRFNVCPRQEAKLLAPGESGEDLVAQIRAELQDFADYLMSHEADQAKARQALDNEPKRLLQAVTQTAIEEVAAALRNGDLEYFIDNRPSPAFRSLLRSPVFEGREAPIRELYRAFLVEALNVADAANKHVVQHELVFAVLELLVGNMPRTKTKLTHRLRHEGLHIESHTRGKTSRRGLGVHWKATSEQIKEWRELVLADMAAEPNNSCYLTDSDAPGHPQEDTTAMAS